MACVCCLLTWQTTCNKVTCPVCRSDLIECAYPYNYKTHKLQHRYNDNSEWVDYSNSDTRKILMELNMQISKKETGGTCNTHWPGNFIIYWGEAVNKNILGLKYCKNSPLAYRSMYTKQLNELNTWKSMASSYGFNDFILVQRNTTHTGMRLVRITKRLNIEISN